MSEDDDVTARIGRALGSNRVVKLPSLPSGGPMDLLHLRSLVADVLRETPTVDAGTRPERAPGAGEEDHDD